jgi:serine/threonine-protein kinase
MADGGEKMPTRPGASPAGSDGQRTGSSPAASPGQRTERTAVGGGAKLRAAAPVDRGTVLADRYQIEQSLGTGGSGAVYRAWDRMLGELVAIKVLHPEWARDRSWIKRLAREVKVARAIRHPNVCRVFELGQSQGMWFITMELATAGSLRDALRDRPSGGGPTPAQRLADVKALASGLAAIHAVGITHRDVTPQNVLRMADGRLVLTDFGLAIERDDQTSIHGGTPGYMPPEAARGERSDQRSDVYQLGVIMHEVLYRSRPAWAADGTRLLPAEQNTEAEVDVVRDELARVVADCLHADPAHRPPTAVAVAGRLAAAEAAQPVPPAVRVVRRLERFGRRYGRLLKVAGVALALAVLVRVVQLVSQPPLCRGAGDQLAGIWDGARAEAVGRAFARSGKSYAAESFGRVRQLLDEYAGRWKEMYTDACEATHVRGEQSADVLDLRMTCLRERKDELQALADLFQSGEPQVVARSIGAAAGLSPIVECAEVPRLRAVVRPPERGETRTQVEELRRGLADVRALHAAGRYSESARRAGPLVTEARDLGYEPLLAEALQVLARARLHSGQLGEVEGVLEEAMLLAEGARHDRVLAEAAVDKVALLAAAERSTDLERFMPRAQATLRRIGGDLRLESWIQTALGLLLHRQEKYSASLETHQRALDLKRQVLRPDDPDVALSLGNVAAELHELGRHTEALAANARAVAILERSYGNRHPELALQLQNRGEIRLALGRPVEARADFERALAIWRQELGSDHLTVSLPLQWIGQSYLGERKAGPAIEPLERAHQIRAQVPASPAEQAQTAFALARALWESGRDRSRALGLAARAEALIPAGKTEDRRRITEALAAWKATATNRAAAAAGDPGEPPESPAAPEPTPPEPPRSAL